MIARVTARATLSGVAFVAVVAAVEPAWAAPTPQHSSIVEAVVDSAGGTPVPLELPGQVFVVPDPISFAAPPAPASQLLAPRAGRRWSSGALPGISARGPPAVVRQLTT